RFVGQTAGLGGDAEIDGARPGVIATIGSVVTGGAAPDERCHTEVIVDPLDTRERNRMVVEQVLAARNRSACSRGSAVVVLKLRPGIVGIEDVRVERFTGRITTRERIIDADVKWLRDQG